MCGFKSFIKVVTIAFIIQSGHLISTRPENETAGIERLFSQTTNEYDSGVGLQSHPTLYQLNPERFSRYSGPIKSNVGQPKGMYGTEEHSKQYRPFARPFYNPNEYYQSNFLPPSPTYNSYRGYSQSVMEALKSLTLNDDLRCVPKLLCEVASGREDTYGRKLTLPFNIDINSLIGFLTTFSGSDSSAIVQLGRAALLGYTSGGNSKSCLGAYPRCPQDTDALVNYLNNHNGGFFRFFSGVSNQYPQKYQRPAYLNPPLNWQQRPHLYYKPREIHSSVMATRRIQNTPIRYTPNTFGFKSIYNNAEVLSNQLLPDFEQSTRADGFNPPAHEEYLNSDRRRKQKSILFIDTNDVQRPVKNTKTTAFIFPDRTGTGELILDSEERGHFKLRTLKNNYVDDLRVPVVFSDEKHRTEFLFPKSI